MALHAHFIRAAEWPFAPKWLGHMYTDTKIKCPTFPITCKVGVESADRVSEIQEPHSPLHHTVKSALGSEEVEDAAPSGVHLDNIDLDFNGLSRVNEVKSLSPYNAIQKLVIPECMSRVRISDEEIEDPSLIFGSGSDSPTGDVDSSCDTAGEYFKPFLINAKRQARLRRLRISGLCFAIGLPTASIGGSIFWYVIKFAGRDHVLTFFLGVSVAPGVIFCCLGLLPSDRRAMLVCIGVGASLELLVFSGSWVAIRTILRENERNECKTANREVTCSGYYLFRLVMEAVFFSVHMFIIILSCCSPFLTSRRLLRACWVLTGLSMLNFSLHWLLFAILDFANSFYSLVPIDMTNCVTFFIAGVLALWPNFRFHTQAWLAAKGESAASAAGVAVLLGGSTVKDVIATSRNSFCAVSAEKLTEGDMADQTPNPSLQRLTEKRKLGRVDAFVSHSWHDDPQSKWRELQAWRTDFKKRHGREPWLWIDKYCVDQSNIENSLRCLPVYLMGCKRLLILCGRTYLQRLWCLVEIFTFKEMGGLQSNLECRLLVASEEMQKDIESFNIYSAKCFNEDETYRLLGVMEAGADSVGDLKEWIQFSLRTRLEDRGSNSDCATKIHV